MKIIYPKLTVRTDYIEKNTKFLVGKAQEVGINIMGVTKAVSANEKIVEAFIRAGVKYLADSRLENIIKMQNYPLEKVLLRLPMISESEKVVKYADISLNSEISTIRVLSKAAKKLDKIHKIVIMVDLGDLREGIYQEEELFSTLDELLSLDNLELVGIGTNLTCYGGLIPNKEHVEKLSGLAKEIEDRYNISLDIISGGNSSSLNLLAKGQLKGINNLRLGESLLLGKETAYGKNIDGTRQDAFKLEVEIIEVKYKPSAVTGQVGLDAFGNRPQHEDLGIRKKILAAIGRQDVDISSLKVKDKGLNILGASSDHLIIDGSDSPVDYRVGDILEFDLSYGGVLSLINSDYVKKEII